MNRFVTRGFKSFFRFFARRFGGRTKVQLPVVSPIRPRSESLTARMVLTPRYLNDLAYGGSDREIRQISSLQSIVVEMPPIVAGQCLLSTGETRENVEHMPWHQSAYTAHPAAVFEIQDAVLHGGVGITGVKNYVIAETLWHTTPERHFYERDGENIVLLRHNIEKLAGLHVSLLAGATESYWHSVIDATARLTLVPEDILQNATSVLLPSTGIAQMELIQLYGLPDGVEPRIVHPHESFQVENLIFPSSIHNLFDYHPFALNNFYDRILSRFTTVDKSTSKLIYVDRQASGLRPLKNESVLAQALERFGFEIVRLENLSVGQQVTLFRDAKLIVAPHGAGLTNIGFCSPGCLVIELMMDLYLNWCYRRIAAIRLLRYDCIIGRAVRAPDLYFDSIHGQPWSIAVDDVVAIVENCIAEIAES